MAELSDAAAGEPMRRMLYGDLPIDEWPADDGGSSGEAWAEPWSRFVRARAHLANGDADLAIREWSQVANPIFGWESRQVLQAWHLLRANGIVPDASIAGEVLGLVAEVAVDAGHDVLAAYADGSVRFLHHRGGGSIVEPPAPEPIATAATAWLDAATAAAEAVAPWIGDGAHPAPPGESRFVLLTRAGNRAVAGDAATLAASAVASELLGVGAGLLQAIVAVRPA
ncbi:MAG: hypothetical protein KDB04_19070 [Acidimicrobiales bacterium]|nr:hypothetical protein [Acidimicrobiales bacterium]HRW36668.1 hypothetical protein [Aquihabitans sp.]